MNGDHNKNANGNNTNLPAMYTPGVKGKPERGLKALASCSLAIARFHTILDKTEKKLELELERENRAPQTCIGKTRRNGEKVLHSKPVLFCVIILNVIDCILVLGELVLEMYYVKGLLQSSESLTTTFILDMKTLYPVDLSSIKKTDVEPLYNNILSAHIEWNHSENSAGEHGHMANDHTTKSTFLTTTLHNVEKRSVDLHTEIANSENNNSANNHHTNHTIEGGNTTDSSDPGATTEATNSHDSSGDTVTENMHHSQHGTGGSTSSHDTSGNDANENEHNSPHDTQENSNTHGSDGGEHHGGNGTGSHDEHHEAHVHNLEDELAHAFHKASITILAILAVENIFKIFAYGLHFVSRKLEVFDCVIVFCSLFVDIYFLNGISSYKIRDFVIILAFLVPWRVIRVVNRNTVLYYNNVAPKTIYVWTELQRGLITRNGANPKQLITGLVVAVIDHEHFRLKLLYKQKKEVVNDLKKTKADAKIFQLSLETVKKLAIEAGVPPQKIEQQLALHHQPNGKHKKKGMLSSFHHGFPLFSHSTNSSPKHSHSSPNMKLNNSMKERGKYCDNRDIRGTDNKNFMVDSDLDTGSVNAEDVPNNIVDTNETDIVINVQHHDTED